MEISSTFWLPDITNWWHQQQQIHSKYSDLSNKAHDIFPIISHLVRVEASFSIAQDVISWWQSKITGKTLREKVIVRQFAWDNNSMLAGDYAALDTMETENYLELNKETEERKLHRIAKVYNFLAMCQGSQNLHAIQKKSGAENMQMTAVGYISDTEGIFKASWSNFQHDGAAAFILSERSLLQPALSTKELTEGWTQGFNVYQIRTIDCYPVKRDADCAPVSISITENWLDLNSDWCNANLTDDAWEADYKSDIELDNGIEVPESSEHQDLTTVANVPWLIQQTQWSMKQAKKWWIMVTTMKTRRNKGHKTK